METNWKQDFLKMVMRKTLDREIVWYTKGESNLVFAEFNYNGKTLHLTAHQCYLKVYLNKRTDENMVAIYLDSLAMRFNEIIISSIKREKEYSLERLSVEMVANEYHNVSSKTKDLVESIFKNPRSV